MKQTNDEFKQTDEIKLTDKTRSIQSRANPLLKMFVVVGVVLFCAIVLASSCEKTPVYVHRSTNLVGNKLKLVFTNVDSTIVKITTTNDLVDELVDPSSFYTARIHLNAAKFPTTPLSSSTNSHFGYLIKNAPDNAKKRVFDVAIEDATGGLMLVSEYRTKAAGNKDIFYTGDLREFKMRTFSSDSNDNSDTYRIDGGTTSKGHIPAGLNVFSVFADKRVPKNETQLSEKNAPFAFTASEGTGATQPIFWCVTTLAELGGISSNPPGLENKTLKGGHVASCYVGSLGVGIGDGDNAQRWYEDVTASVGVVSGRSYGKTKIEISFLAIKTDGKRLGDVGLSTRRVNYIKDVGGFGWSYILAGNDSSFINNYLVEIPEKW